MARYSRLVVDAGNNRIQTCPPTGTCTSFGTATGQFIQPFGVAIDAAGNLIIAGAGNHRIQILSPAGLLANDNDPITVTAPTPTSALGATVSVNTDGSFTYDATSVAAVQALNDGETLTDTFDYAFSDGNGGTDTATVSVVVSGIDDDA